VLIVLNADLTFIGQNYFLQN